MEVMELLVRVCQFPIITAKIFNFFPVLCHLQRGGVLFPFLQSLGPCQLARWSESLIMSDIILATHCSLGVSENSKT